MTPSDKESLLDQFRAYLDAVEEGVDPLVADDVSVSDAQTVDLYSLFVELAALKNEVRIESRQLKTALDQFRGLVDPLQAGYAALQDGIESVRRERQEVVRKTLQPLLLDLLELRDRMLAASADAAERKSSGLAQRLFRKEWEIMDLWREGQSMTVRRLDQILASQGVTPLALIGCVLDPHVARAVQVEQHEGLENGIVLAEVRQGFLWNGLLLRTAEVVVNSNNKQNISGEE